MVRRKKQFCISRTRCSRPKLRKSRGHDSCHGHDKMLRLPDVKVPRLDTSTSVAFKAQIDSLTAGEYPNLQKVQQRSSNAKGRSGERSLRHAPRYRRPGDIGDAGWAPEIWEKGLEANSSLRVHTNRPHNGCRAIPQNRPDVRVRSAKYLELLCFAPDRSARRRLGE